MARILYSFYFYRAVNENQLGSFHESLVDELLKNGNEVMTINTKFFDKIGFSDENSILSDVNENKIIDRIKDFNPEVIFAFNNNIVAKVQRSVSCPILFWAGDSVNLFSQKNNLNLLLKNTNNFIVVQGEFLEQEFLGLGIDQKNIINVGHATSVRTEDLKKDKEISFIGNIFTNLRDLEAKTKLQGIDYKRLLTDSIKLLKDIDSFESVREKEPSFRNFSVLELYSILDIRNDVVTYLSDYDLHLYGPLWNKSKFSDFHPSIICSHRQKEVMTLKDNQNIYNSSVLCLNVNHPQGGYKDFSWRVFDIMASSGCLLTNFNYSIQKMFKDYGIDIPMFSTPSESYFVARKLLDDSKLRNDIVEVSNQIAKEKGTWHRIIRLLENNIGIKLVNNIKEDYNLNISSLKLSDVKKKKTIRIIKRKELIKLLPFFIAKKML